MSQLPVLTSNRHADRRRLPQTRLVVLTLWGVLLTASLGLVAQSQAQDDSEATIDVTTTADVRAQDGFCSLREAIQAANTGMGSGQTPGECPTPRGLVITIVLQAETYRVEQATDDDPDSAYTILVPITLQGDATGSSIIARPDQAPAFRLFSVVAQGALTLEQVTLSGGQVNGDGGAIRNSGRVTLSDTSIIRSTATGQGGGLFIDSAAVATVTQSTFSSNTAFAGAGIANHSDGTVTIVNSVFTGHQATNGGAISNAGEAHVNHSSFLNNGNGFGGAVLNSGSLTVVSSTFQGNVARSGGAIWNIGVVDIAASTLAVNEAESDGGGILNSAVGAMQLDNVTISGNVSNRGGGIVNQGQMQLVHATVVGNGAPVAPHLLNVSQTTLSGSILESCHEAQFTSAGGNVFGHDNCVPLAGAEDRVSAALVLGELTTYGGLVATHALLPGSPAIDAAGLTRCPATDGRGFARPQGDACDSGAYEMVLEPLTAAITSDTEASAINVGDLLQLKVIASQPREQAVEITEHVDGSCVSTNPAVATVSQEPGSKCLMHGISPGEAVIFYLGVLDGTPLVTSSRFNVAMTESSAHDNAADRTATRQYNWAVAMGGAYDMVLDLDIASTSEEVLQDHGRLVQFFESTRFNEMAPHNELAFGGTEYILANPGSSYIAYAANLVGEMGLQGLQAGTYDLTWFDIPTGTTVVQSSVSVAAGNQSWPRPEGIGTEVALSVVRQDAEPAPAGESILLHEAFDRPDSVVVGNSWTEIESQSFTHLRTGTLVFEAFNDAFRPLIQHDFAAQTTGRLTWTFDLNVQRTGAEGTYAFWMQLGQGTLMSTANPTAPGVAVNLLWGSPDQGLSTHEGFGYVVNGVVTQIATVSGGPTPVTVEVDLEQQTYSVSVAGQQAAAIPFDNNVSLDTLRFFANELNRDNFAALQIDNVVVHHAVPDVENSPPPPDPTLDTTPPRVSLTIPVPGATVSGATTVSAQATDEVGVVSVQFYLDGSPLEAEDTTVPYTITWDTTSFSNGLYTLSAVAKDAAGNATIATSIEVIVNNGPVSIDSFTATPDTIVVGGTATLAWTTTNASSVAIDNGVGLGLPTTGSTDVAPVRTTTYTLTATGNGTTATRAVTVTASPAPVPDSTIFRQDSGPDGLVVLEAEHFQANHAQGNHNWNLSHPTGASGNAAMQALPNSNTNNNTGYTSQSPQLAFEVQFVHTGTHYIWVRGLGASGSDDSVHVGLDDQASASSDRLSSFGTNWTWSQSTMDGEVATVVVPTVGMHTVNVWMREDGFVVDKLLLTTSTAYEPSGTGPTESPQGTGGTSVTLELEAELGDLSHFMEIGFDRLTSTTYIWVPDGYGQVLDPTQDGETASYAFETPEADTYVIWGHVRPSATGTGSFFVTVDTDPYRIWEIAKTPSQTAGVESVSSVSPTTYDVTLLHVGDRYYVDRTYTITAMPAELEGLVAVQTANNDKHNQNAESLTFSIAQDAALYIAYDSRARRYPSWLTQSYTQTGHTIETTDVPLTVWQRAVSAGPISIPGNQHGNPRDVYSNYLVLLALHEPREDASWVWDQVAAQTMPVIFLEAGSHTLTITQRESGTQLDQLLLTNELEFVPQD